MRPPRLLPVMLNAEKVRALIVGGGAVASRRARAFVDAGVAVVSVVAPEVATDMPSAVLLHRRHYQRGDVKGFTLVVAATDDPAVNAAVAAECEERGVWCNRADDAEAGGLVVPASVRNGPIVAAVSAGSPAVTRHVAGVLTTTIAPLADFAAAAELVRGEGLRITDVATSEAAFRRGGLEQLRASLNKPVAG